MNRSSDRRGLEPPLQALTAPEVGEQSEGKAPAEPRKGSPWLTILGWLVVLGLLWWVLRSFPLMESLQAIGRLTVAQIVLLLTINLIIIGTYAVRWGLILLGHGYRLPVFAVMGYRLATFGLSYFTPGPQVGGEALQIILPRTKHAVPTSVATAAVGLDKLVELAMNFAFVAAGLLVAVELNLNAPLLLLSWALVGLPLIFLILLWLGHQPFTVLLAALPDRWQQNPGLRRLQEGVAESEAHAVALCQRKPWHLFWAFTVTAAGWFLVILEAWLMLQFLGANVTLNQAFIIITAARIAFLLPLPGGLGALEASLVFMLELLDFNPALGLSLALLVRARDVLFGALGLLIGAAALGNWSNLWSATKSHD
ncbi:MAG: flippase-like domain-containing protein [Chloroflexi bacterium]|nr:flippase-like domain-containing protein [Chloroflexota bacterium]